ncbi:MAG: malate dehydrogenase [Candidatus Omnitrophica bacterium]|nr:malate dehydrogenase [Candidatus Omnitrophota bacterium]
MKLSIIGSGNVGGLTAMRILGYGFSKIILLDIQKNLAEAKALDLEDSGSVYKYNYDIEATSDIQRIESSQLIIITAGFSRKPQMTREELLEKNAKIIKDLVYPIKKLCSEPIVIVVSNPVDILTYLFIKESGFSSKRVFGIGPNLDSARFANLIHKELNISPSEIEAMVIGSHGEGMIPLPRFTFIKGVPLNKFLDEERIKQIIDDTIKRGSRIVSLFGSGSAYFGPSAAIEQVVKSILKDEKHILGLSAYLSGEYGFRDLCIGVPCVLGKNGIEKIIELELNSEEKEKFLKSVDSINKQKNLLKEYALL